MRSISIQHRPKRITVAAALSFVLTAGCTSGKSIYYPVIGLGFVRVTPESPAPKDGEGAITVARVEACGALLGSGPNVAGFHVGYMSTQSVSVPSSAEVIVEAKSKPFSPLNASITTIGPQTRPATRPFGGEQ